MNRTDKIVLAMGALALAVAITLILVSPERTNGSGRHTPGCNTYKCDKRMERKNHAKTLKKWATVAKPHRAWLNSTGDCETRGYSRKESYKVNTGNGFYGRYQFTLSSWQSVGGKGYPHEAEPLEQDYRTVRLLKVQGRGAWPICG